MATLGASVRPENGLCVATTKPTGSPPSPRARKARTSLRSSAARRRPSDAARAATSGLTPCSTREVTHRSVKEGSSSAATRLTLTTGRLTGSPHTSTGHMQTSLRRPPAPTAAASGGVRGQTLCPSAAAGEGVHKDPPPAPHRVCGVSVDFPGLGTVINVATVIVGSLLGMAVGHRLPHHTRSVVTDVLGLTTLLMAGLSVVSVTDPAFGDATGIGAPVLIVLGSLLLGGIGGSLLRIEERLEGLAGTVQRKLARHPRWADAADERGADHAARERFIEGWLSASLLFCVGPLTILGSLSDGLGNGIEQLTLKSVLDGFAAMAFASSFGVGVLFSAVSVAVVQGLLTLLGVLLGSVLPDAHIAALTATGGLMLVGIALRLLRIREVPVGDLLPALVVAPLLTQLVIALS